MAKFIYLGPVQTVQLAVGTAKNNDGEEVAQFREFTLMPDGEPIELPEKHPLVLSWLDSGVIEPSQKDEPASEAEPKPKPAPKTTTSEKGDK